MYEDVATEKGVSYKDSGMAGLHSSNPFSKLPGIYNIETNKLMFGPELLDWSFTFCWDEATGTLAYRENLTETLAAMIAMVFSNIPITVAVDVLGSKMPTGLEMLITYMRVILGLKIKPKFKKTIRSRQQLPNLSVRRKV